MKCKLDNFRFKALGALKSLGQYSFLAIWILKIAVGGSLIVAGFVFMFVGACIGISMGNPVGMILGLVMGTVGGLIYYAPEERLIDWIN